MTPLERELARQAQALREIEDDATRRIGSTYLRVLARLDRNLNDLMADIERARARGQEISPSWLLSQQRYRRLIQDMEEEINAFLARTTPTVRGAQESAVQAAIRHGQRLVRAALGIAPRQAVAIVEAKFDRLPVDALRYLVGRAHNGGPLGALIAEISPLAVEQVTDALAYGVAAGKNPRVVAQEVRTAGRMPLVRALTISRTEIIGAHRAAATESYQSTRIVTTKVWSAQLDTRTCAVCWAMHGQEFPLDAVMASHPNCRCAWAPRTLSWAQLGFAGVPDRRPAITPGPARFAALPEADRLAILGRRKLDAYNAGRVSLQDLVKPTASPRWGAGRREATLRELAL